MQKQPFADVLLPACNFLKKRLRDRCFPVNYAKFFKNTFFIEHFRMTASDTVHECSALFRSSHPEVFLRKGFLKYAANLQENTHAEV